MTQWCWILFGTVCQGGRDRSLRVIREADFAQVVAERCLSQTESDPRLEWSYKTAALYGFGILTTLGYGKVEPRTHNGRIFTVVYGFLGIPLTVILLTNLGRYLEQVAMTVRSCCKQQNRIQNRRRQMDDDEIDEVISSGMLLCIVVIYLVSYIFGIVGAVLIPPLSGDFDFFNGLYFAFICLTAIEYGDLVPDNLQVQELITAVGQNIGIDQNIMADIDIDTLVKAAIDVKMGRMLRVPQTHMIVEGIWPPELVPLFMKDGKFPMYVDSEEDLLDIKPKKTVVRFEDELDVSSLADDTLTSETMNLHSSRLSPVPPRVVELRSYSDSLYSIISTPSAPFSQSLLATPIETEAMVQSLATPIEPAPRMLETTGQVTPPSSPVADVVSPLCSISEEDMALEGTHSSEFTNTSDVFLIDE